MFFQLAYTRNNNVCNVSKARKPDDLVFTYEAGFLCVYMHARVQILCMSVRIVWRNQTNRRTTLLVEVQQYAFIVGVCVCVCLHIFESLAVKLVCDVSGSKELYWSLQHARISFLLIA